jgi:hypothetical protein
VFSQDPLEKFFGQARQRCGGNFYIDVADILSAAKVQRLHQLIKHDVVNRAGPKPSMCEYCELTIDARDLELVNDITVNDTQTLLESDNTLKHTVVYVAGYLMRKFGTQVDEADDEPCANSDFIKELNRGGLTIPTLSTVFLVHSANHLISALDCQKKNCCAYCSRLISRIESPMAANVQACRTLVNILEKARVLDTSDTEQRLGCLRRQEKLQKDK